jgi:hypothetical protein
VAGIGAAAAARAAEGVTIMAPQTAVAAANRNFPQLIRLIFVSPRTASDRLN